MKYACPVCHSDNLEEEPFYSYEVCPKCYFESGVDDSGLDKGSADRAKWLKTLRDNWLKTGDLWARKFYCRKCNKPCTLNPVPPGGWNCPQCGDSLKVRIVKPEERIVKPEEPVCSYCAYPFGQESPFDCGDERHTSSEL